MYRPLPRRAALRFPLGFLSSCFCVVNGTKFELLPTRHSKNESWLLCQVLFALVVDSRLQLEAAHSNPRQLLSVLRGPQRLLR